MPETIGDSLADNSKPDDPNVSLRAARHLQFLGNNFGAESREKLSRTQS
jgi:hypothetical protein